MAINFDCPICSQHMYDVRNPCSKEELLDFILYCPNCGYYKTIKEEESMYAICWTGFSGDLHIRGTTYTTIKDATEAIDKFKKIDEINNRGTPANYKIFKLEEVK